MAYSLDSQQKVWILSKFGFRNKSQILDLFRHSKAVHMLEAGIPLIYIRNFLGHESVQTTEIYLRIHQGSVAKILKEKLKQIYRLHLNNRIQKNRIYPILFRTQDNNYVMSFWDKRLKYSILVGVSRSQKLST